MPRENAHDKGRRLLTEGRLVVTAVSERHVSARCRDDSGEIYTLAADHRGYSCSCPAIGQCSHLVALMLVTLKPLPTRGPGPNGQVGRHEAPMPRVLHTNGGTEMRTACSQEGATQ